MTPLAWMRAIRDTDLPATTKAVAWAIGLRADRHGNCWPSYKRIAEDAGAGRRTVVYHVAALVQAGWLMAVNRANGHGDQANSYLLTTPPPSLWKTKGGSAGAAPGGVQQVHPLVQQVHPLGGAGDAPRRRGIQRSEAEPENLAVDNHHLAAVIGLMSRQTRIP